MTTGSGTQLPGQSPGGPTRVLRLTFSYEGNKIRLVSRQSVEMILPPSDPGQGYEGESGFWYSLNDPQERTVYRRVMQSPIRHDVEVFSDDPKESISRAEVSNPRGSFVLLVPDVAEARTLSLYSHSLRPQSAATPSSSEIARFDLDAQENQGEGR